MKLLILPLALALAACGSPDAIENNSAGAAALPDPETPVASATGAAPAIAAPPEDQGQATGAAIPAPLHGRWALSPGDCTSARGDAKGLLTVSAGSLRFYESRAVPTSTLQTSATSANGQFIFTGEGKEWARYQSLDLQGETLVRTERDPLASFTYVRC